MKELVEKFNEKIKLNPSWLEKRNCLCNSDRYKLLSEIDRYGFYHPVVVCKDCGLIYSRPNLSEEAYKYFYSSDIYRNVYTNIDPIKDAELRFETKSGQHIYDDLQPFINQNLSVLEFGCGGGWNLVKFKEAGHRTVGIDYSPILTEFGRKRDFNLITGGLNEIEGIYDLIIVNHVAEHFVDFQKDMQKIISHLSKDGIIYVGLPNIDNFCAGQFQNAHVRYFSPETFKHYFAKLSLSMIWFDPCSSRIHMAAIFKISNNVSAKKLDNEYQRIFFKIIKGRLRDKSIKFLEMLNLKNFIRDLLQK